VKRVPVMACLVAVSSAGCVHFHLDDGAPGHVDLRAPPAFPEVKTVESARPPGETMLVVTPAVFGLTGSHAGAHTNLLGAELSVEWGWDPATAPTMHLHRGDDRLAPRHGWGLTLGAQMAFAPGSWRPSAGPITAELRRSLVGAFFAGGGWIWDPRTHRHGAVATALAGIFMVRGGYLWGAGGFVSIGLNFFFPITWVWTR
jgi:hypothetical protein